MVNIHFCANIEYELIPYEQCKNRPAVVLRKDRSAFEKEVRLLNEIIADKKRLKDETEKYYSRNLKSYQLIFEPYRGRLLGKSFLIGLLPSLMSKSKWISLLNMILCESHRDKMLYFLNNKKNKI